MSASDKNIPVHFTAYDPYEALPSCSIKLGSISGADLDKIMSELETHTPAADACINRLHAEYTESATLTPVPGKRYRRLELANVFAFKHGTLPCVKRMKATDNEIQLMHMCAKNLAAGKCKDEFIRRTLGATLFPELYGKDKQK